MRQQLPDFGHGRQGNSFRTAGCNFNLGVPGNQEQQIRRLMGLQFGKNRLPGFTALRSKTSLPHLSCATETCRIFIIAHSCQTDSEASRLKSTASSGKREAFRKEGSHDSSYEPAALGGRGRRHAGGPGARLQQSASRRLQIFGVRAHQSSVRFVLQDAGMPGAELQAIVHRLHALPATLCAVHTLRPVGPVATSPTEDRSTAGAGHAATGDLAAGQQRAL